MRTSSQRSLPLLILAFVAFVSLGLPDGVLGVAWPSIRGEFGVEVGQLGWLLLSGMVGYLASSFISGWLVHRIGIGLLLTVSSGLILGVMATFALAGSWWMIVGVGMFAGLGAGAIDAGLNAFAARRFSPTVVNWLHACYGLGATLGPTLMLAAMAGGAGWRMGYTVLAGTLAAMTVAFAVTARRWDGRAEGLPDGGGQSPAGRGDARFRAALRQPVVWGGMAWFFVYTGIEVTAGQWTYTLLVEERGFSPQWAGIAVSLYWGCLTVGRIAFGFAASRWSAAVILRICTLLMPPCAAVLWLSPNPWASIASMAILGFLLAPMFPLMISLTPLRVGEVDSAHAVGFQISAAALGAAVLPALVGAAAQQRGLAAIGPCLLVESGALLAIYSLLTRRHGSRRVGALPTCDQSRYAPGSIP